MYLVLPGNEVVNEDLALPGQEVLKKDLLLTRQAVLKNPSGSVWTGAPKYFIITPAKTKLLRLIPKIVHKKTFNIKFAII